MACFFVTLDGNVPVTLHYKFQQSVHMTVVVPRPQFIYGVGHCSYVPETGIPLLLTVQKTSLARLLSSRCCATTGAWVDSAVSWRCRCCSLSTVVDIPVVVVQTVHGEVPQLQFFDCRRNSSCGAEAVWGCKLRENRRLSTGAVFFHSFRGELITQVMSSWKLVSVTDVTSRCFVAMHIHLVPRCQATVEIDCMGWVDAC